MDIEPLEIYARDTNYAVIKPPGRHYPGAVIQGDSLGILCRTALRLAAMVDADPDSSEDLRGETEDLADALLDRVLHYQSVLAAHGIDCPYGRPFSEADRIKLLPDDDD